MTRYADWVEVTEQGLRLSARLRDRIFNHGQKGVRIVFDTVNRELILESADYLQSFGNDLIPLSKWFRDRHGIQLGKYEVDFIPMGVKICLV